MFQEQIQVPSDSYKLALLLTDRYFYLVVQNPFTPCRFGIRMALLYPPACRKRRLKKGVRGNLVVTSAAARCQGPRSTRAEIWIEISAPCTPMFRLWDHSIGYQSQSQAWKLT